MGRVRFVQPTAVRLALSDGDFINVRKELTAGEERAAFRRMVKHMAPGEPVELDPEQVELSTIVAYLLDWSFLDAQGQPVPVSEDAILNLDTETFQELSTAINAHAAAHAQEKKTARAIGTTSSQTSPSPGV